MSIEALEARIAAAERKHETFRLAALEWGDDIDTHSRLIDTLWQRVEALEVVTGLEKRCDLQCDLACLRRALEQLNG